MGNNTTDRDKKENWNERFKLNNMKDSIGKKVLIVEDEKSLLDLIAEKFSSEGFTIFKAKDGIEGLAMSFKNHPDMILLDVIMPKMNGMEMLKHLRNDKWGKNVQVMLLTNLSTAEKSAEALEGGAIDYLVKTDWKLEDVAKKVKARLGVL